MFKLFGINNAAGSIYPMACSLGTIILAYACGKLLFNIRTGLLAALLICFYPLNVIYASWFMPDVPVDFFTSAGILVFLHVYKKERSMSEFKKHVLLYAGGFLFGIAYLANVRSIISFFVIAPLAAVWLWKKRSNKKRLFTYFTAVTLFFIGFASVVMFEGMYHWKKSGDFLLTYHRTTAYYSDKSGFLLEGVNTHLDYYPNIMFNLDHRMRFSMGNKMLIYGYFFLFFAAATVFLLLRRERRMLIPFWWFIALFFYLQFGSMSFKEYIPIHRLDRHLTVITIPAVVIIAACMSHLIAFRLRRNRFVAYLNRFIVAAALIFLLKTSLEFSAAIVADMRAPAYDMQEIYNVLKDYPEKDIYADPGVLSHLHFYFQFKNSHLRHNIQYSLPTHDSYVVLDGTRGFMENPRLRSSQPVWMQKPDPSWELIRVIKGPRIGIYADFDPKIYHVP